MAIECAKAKAPPSWRWLPLRRVSEIRREANTKRQEPLLALSVERGIEERAEDGGRQLASETTESAYWVVHPNDLVFNPMWALEGSVAVSTRRGAVSPAYRVYKLAAQLHPPFVHHFMRSRIALEQYRALVRGVTTFDRAVTREDLDAMPIPVPPLEHQRTIADSLDSETARIDALIGKKRTLVDSVEARWRADLLSRLAVAEEPGLGATPWLPDSLPDGWAVAPLKRLIWRSWGGHWGDDPGVAEIDLPCVRAVDFQFADLRAVSGAPRSFGRAAVATRMLRPGDLVIEKSGGGEGVPVGRVVAWRGLAPAVPTNFAGGLRPSAGVDANFVLLVFRAAYEIGLPWRSIKQTTGLQNLEVGHYLGHPWAVPPVETQCRIAEELLQALTQARQVQASLLHQIGLLQERREALITAAVTGELEVPGVAA